jgi:2-oxoglutarate dehydrogenase E1 component
LPHGYDGQGPEHSSARIERYLDLCDEDPYTMPCHATLGKKSVGRQHQDCNMQVCYPTVPSNYFHLLRRQVHRDFRKPLIIFTSKALLRHPMAKSAMDEMTGDTRFQRLIPEVLHSDPLQNMEIHGMKSTLRNITWSGHSRDSRIPYAMVTSQDPPKYTTTSNSKVKKESFTLDPPEKIKTLIFCSGQVYYLLAKARAANDLKHIAIVRIEQISPFPFWECKEVVDFYPNLQEVVYCQEESFNSGSWTFIEPRLDTAIKASHWYKTKGKQWAQELEDTRVSGGITNAKLGIPKSIRGGYLVRYAGRDISAAPATGIKKLHAFEEKMFVSEAFFKGELRKPKSIEQGVPIY